MLVHRWLKEYVLVRSMDKSKKGCQLMPILYTYTVTIVWHGLEPGYPIFFVYVALQVYSQ